MKVTGEMITLMRTKVCQTRHKREDFMKIMALILVSSKTQSFSKLLGRKYIANNHHCHHVYYLHHHHRHLVSWDVKLTCSKTRLKGLNNVVF